MANTSHEAAQSALLAARNRIRTAIQIAESWRDQDLADELWQLWRELLEVSEALDRGRTYVPIHKRTSAYPRMMFRGDTPAST